MIFISFSKVKKYKRWNVTSWYEVSLNTPFVKRKSHHYFTISSSPTNVSYLETTLRNLWSVVVLWGEKVGLTSIIFFPYVHIICAGDRQGSQELNVDDIPFKFTVVFLLTEIYYFIFNKCYIIAAKHQIFGKLSGINALNSMDYIHITTS